MSVSKLQLSRLLETYGALLTEKQREAAVMYCDCDCSLSEIADESGISRQGVRDAIVKAEAALTKFESELHLAEFALEAERLLDCDDGKLKELVKRFIVKGE